LVIAKGFFFIFNETNNAMYKNAIQVTEYHPYFQKYMDNVGDKPLIKSLKSGLDELLILFEGFPKEKHEYRYAEGKWTPKELLLHMVDTERVFCYRALRFARSENNELEGFDENEFALNSHANERTMKEILKEYVAVRIATILLFESFSDSVLSRSGIANDHRLSVRATGFIIYGHEQHHINIIKEHYLQ
jgi:hypothetical protein